MKRFRIMALALATIWVAATVLQARAAGPATITLQPATTYQTMSGLEATAQAGQLACSSSQLVHGTVTACPAFLAVQSALVDKAVNELGITRLRLEITPGVENPTDYFSQVLSGQISVDTWDGTYATRAVNDNSDANTINANGFHFSSLDHQIDSLALPMRQALAARGEHLSLNVCFVGFGSNPSGWYHWNSPQEYAELVLATYQHVQAKYGFTPDTWEMELEPDNTAFDPTKMASAIQATIPKLQAAGFTPHFVIPSTTSMSTAQTYFNYIAAVLGDSAVRQYISSLSYHRYAGVSDSALQWIGDTAHNYGIGGAMLEHINSNYSELHQDLKTGQNNAWAEYVLAAPYAWNNGNDDGTAYYMVDDRTPSNATVQNAWQTRYFRQYFSFIRPGAVRLGASTTDVTIDPLYFRNSNGNQVVVMRATAAGAFNIQGLPAGTYGIKYTTESAYNVDEPDVAISGGQAVAGSIPAAGVVTVYSKTGVPAPTATPTRTQPPVPTNTATALPTRTATLAPTNTPLPTNVPTQTATRTNTPAPTAQPTNTPTGVPTTPPSNGALTITAVRFLPLTLSCGNNLRVEIDVRNDSSATAVTQGPPPGFTYNEGDTFRSDGYGEVGSDWRVGVDFAARASGVVDHPYRWGLGSNLAPGQSTTVIGYVRLTTARSSTYWAGLVQEGLRWQQDGLGTGTITVNPATAPTATPSPVPTLSPSPTANPSGALTVTGVQFSPTTMVTGGLLHVDISVRNDSSVTALTQGPPPGFTYNEGDTPSSRGYPDQAGRWRVGVEFAGRTGMDHPYRWGLGADLAPGQSTVVTGYIHLTTVRTTNYWVGMVQEGVRWQQDNLGTTSISVTSGAPPTATPTPVAGSHLTVTGVQFSPTTLAVGSLLRVDITVRNDGSTTAVTQGPPPGFIYNESDTFRSVGYPEMAGDWRIGVDFIGRSGSVDHPFRWGLGSNLAPGQTATITGYIRVSTRATTTVWAGLVQEGMRWQQDNLAPTTITIQ